MEPLSAKLEEMGAHLEIGDEWIRVFVAEGEELLPASFKTMPYPGFPTDLQPQTTILLATVPGTSRMLETVWENRFQYVDELKMMGAQIMTSGQMAIIEGVPQLTSAVGNARDLRAGAAMVLAGLVAEGTTEVTDIAKIERGYEKFIDKLRSLGAEITRVER
jgi:UDP-N-acetylglucosamine 1-carboxyvinyltransferase